MKALKVIGISLLALIILLSAATGIVLNFIFTPQKVTPAVTTILNENLNAEVQLEAVELTFFTSFPYLGVRLRNGTLISHARYSRPADPGIPCDTLVQFAECRISVNPFAYLIRNQIRVKAVRLVDPVIHAYVDPAGRANWEIFKPEAVQEDPASGTDTTPADQGFMADFLSVKIEHGRVDFRDCQTSLYASAAHINFSAKGSLGERQTDLSLLLSAEQVRVISQEELLANDLSIGLDARFTYSSEDDRVGIPRAALTLNGIELVATGAIAGNKEATSADVDLRVGLRASSLTELLQMVPAGWLDQRVRVVARGKAEAEARVKGTYGYNQLPLISGKVVIREGYASYEGLPGSIDLLEADIDFFLDLKRDQPSWIRIDSVKADAGTTRVEVTGTLSDLLGDPRCDSRLVCHVDFSELSGILPFEEGVTLAGLLACRMNLECLLDDLIRNRYERIRISGELEATGLNLESRADSFQLQVGQARILVATNDSTAVVQGSLSLDTLKVALNNYRIRMEGAVADAVTLPWRPDLDEPAVAGSFGFRYLEATSPSFPLPVRFDPGRFSFSADELILHQAFVRVGNSSLRLTGGIRFLPAEGTSNSRIRSNVYLESDLIDLNELSWALQQGTLINKPEGVQKKGEPSSLNAFVVPPELDAIAEIKVNKVLIHNLVLDSIHGLLRLRDQTIDLSDMTLSNQGATFRTSLLYQAPSPDSLYLGIDLDFQRVDLAILTATLGTLDTLLPMLQALEGKVDFRMVAEAWLDSSLTIRPQTLRGAASILADSLVILDSKSFREIARTLQFENRERNLVDALSAEIILEDGMVEVLPFLIQMDVYKAIVGGKNSLDLNLSYHVSLVSPLRISADITGTPDDVKVKLVKSRYRHQFIPDRKGVVDSTALLLRKKIRDDLRSGRYKPGMRGGGSGL